MGRKRNRGWVIMTGFAMILVLFLPFFSGTSKAITAEVIITLDRHDIECDISTNSSEIVVSGNVTCNMDGLGENIFQIEVTLWADDSHSWSPGVGPSIMLFSESGRKSINLSFIIPPDVYNSTENTITVSGSWKTVPYNAGVLGITGSAVPDRVNVTVNRTVPIGAPNTITPPYEEYDTWWEELNRIQKAGMISIPVIIVIVIIIAIYYRKRKNDRLLDEL
jgi:hypothetical protein